MYKSLLGMMLLTCTLLGIAQPTYAQNPPNTSNAEILDVIPHDCWGFIAIRNLREFDEKLSQFCKQIDLTPFSLLNSLETRINIGPTIKPDGSFAIVFMPTDTLATLGTNSVLVFPCEDVEAFLKNFQTSRL